MSRTKLKKELSAMTAPQLVEVILDAYSARNEIRDYFEYFLEPYPDKLYEKYRLAIDKELQRVKRNMLKARTSHINAAIKTFDSFSPGIDYQIKLRQYVLDSLRSATWAHYYTASHMNLAGRLTTELLRLGDRSETFAEVYNDINIIADHVSRRVAREFRDAVHEAIDKYESTSSISK